MTTKCWELRKTCISPLFDSKNKTDRPRVSAIPRLLSPDGIKSLSRLLCDLLPGANPAIVGL